MWREKTMANLFRDQYYRVCVVSTFTRFFLMARQKYAEGLYSLVWRILDGASS